MRPRPARAAVALAAALAAGCASAGGRGAPAPLARTDADVQAACDSVLAFLETLPGATTAVGPGAFDDFVLGATRTGCCVETVGSFAALGGLRPADDLRDRMGERGWREDLRYAADGPDGTAWAMESGDVFCLVEGRWDGGDDADPATPPSDEYRLRACCAPRAQTAGGGQP